VRNVSPSPREIWTCPPRHHRVLIALIAGIFIAVCSTGVKFGSIIISSLSPGGVRSDPYFPSNDVLDRPQTG